ncbi:hypothetical protein [Streptomyces sp. NPDC095613]|uniref:hypothetical protein n=1 Tax=Streptomyces sp. NPDC095613 TaxID=3155540 RepID=UPI0033185530
MANLVYKRVSTDRQNLVLAEAGIENPVVFEEEAAADRAVAADHDGREATGRADRTPTGDGGACGGRRR